MNEEIDQRIFDPKKSKSYNEHSPEYIRLFSDMDPEADASALNMAGLVVEAVLCGHVCLPLDPARIRKSFAGELLQKLTDDDIWQMISALRKSNIVDLKGHAPLTIEEDRVYIQKYWHYEKVIAEWIRARSKKESTGKENLLHYIGQYLRKSNYNDRQRIAIALSALKDLVVVTGGPGTGKTHTVRGILKLLMDVGSAPLNIALCAPTGKAAQKLAESMEEELGQHPNAGRIVSQTIHRLLGADRFGSRFRYGDALKVPYDVIVADEASMLDIRMWYHLLQALKEDTKLIILGDKDQLSSVEAGSLLGDICMNREGFSPDMAQIITQSTGSKDVPVLDGATTLHDHIVYLNQTYRYRSTGGIGNLAENIRSGRSDRVLEELKSHKDHEVRYLPAKKELLPNIIKEFGADQYKNEHSAKDYFEISKQKRILGITRHGFFGTNRINNAVERLIRSQYGFPDNQEWYNGRIILSSRNDDLIGVRNGEIGFSNYMDKDYTIEFEGTPGVQIPVQRLRNYEPAYAMTIHKSQGSEFDHVAVVISPEVREGYLSRELLYTAVTRARESVLIMGDPKDIAAAIDNPLKRNSGLHTKLVN